MDMAGKTAATPLLTCKMQNYLRIGAARAKFNANGAEFDLALALPL